MLFRWALQMDPFLLFREDLLEDLPADFYSLDCWKVSNIPRGLYPIFQLFLFRSSGLFRLLPRASAASVSSVLLVARILFRFADFIRLFVLTAGNVVCMQRAKIISNAARSFTPPNHFARRQNISKSYARRENHSVFRIQDKRKGSHIGRPCKNHFVYSSSGSSSGPLSSGTIKPASIAKPSNNDVIISASD